MAPITIKNWFQFIRTFSQFINNFDRFHEINFLQKESYNWFTITGVCKISHKNLFSLFRWRVFTSILTLYSSLTSILITISPMITAKKYHHEMLYKNRMTTNPHWRSTHISTEHNTIFDMMDSTKKPFFNFFANKKCCCVLFSLCFVCYSRSKALYSGVRYIACKITTTVLFTATSNEISLFVILCERERSS